MSQNLFCVFVDTPPTHMSRPLCFDTRRFRKPIPSEWCIGIYNIVKYRRIPSEAVEHRERQRQRQRKIEKDGDKERKREREI